MLDKKEQSGHKSQETEILLFLKVMFIFWNNDTELKSYIVFLLYQLTYFRFVITYITTTSINIYILDLILYKISLFPTFKSQRKYLYTNNFLKEVLWFMSYSNLDGYIYETQSCY